MPDSSKEELPALLTVAEAARELRMTAGNVYVKIAAGEIPVVRIGRTIRITRRWLADKIAAAEACETTAAEIIRHG